MKVIKSVLLAVALLAQSVVAVAANVNVNTADADEIASVLQGVGQQKAAAIVAFREEHGPFRAVEDILQVRGIGASTLEANRERIVLD